MSADSAAEAPAWFGSAARGMAVLPLLMAVYLVFYAAWWPFAWGVPGGVAFAVAGALAVWATVRGVHQLRHARSFPSVPSAAGARVGRAMGVLNSVTHPLWMSASIVLLLSGHGRGVLPVMVFVIGAHFVPMAFILRRRIDLLLGPIAMAFAAAAGVLALDREVGWLVVFGVAGLGGALATGAYAVYMSAAYARLCAAAKVSFAPGTRRPSTPTPVSTPASRLRS